MDQVDRVSIHLVDTLEAIDAMRKAGCRIYYKASEEKAGLDIYVHGTPGLDNEWDSEWREYLEMYRPRIEDLAPVLWDAHREACREAYPEATGPWWFPVSECAYYILAARGARQ